MTAGDGPRGIPPDGQPARPGAPGASPAGAQEHSPQEAAAGAQGADQAGAAAGPPDGSAARASEPYPVPTVTLRHVAKAFGAVHALEAVARPLRRRGRTRWPARTAPASPPWSRCSPACTARRRQVLARRRAGRPHRPGRRARRRHRGHLPGADAVPRPVGRREHLHGPPAAARRGRHRPARDAAPAPPRCSPASASRSTRTGSRRGLSIADQQLVEIAKALSLDARVLVMDEPTAALSATRSPGCSASPRALRDQRGRASLFISHRLEEVFALCQRVTVLRDGASAVAASSAG